MFRKLENRCRFAVVASMPSIYPPYRLRVTCCSEKQSEKTYDAEYLPLEEGILEAVKLNDGSREYVLLVSELGHYCDCPDFANRASINNEPCKHLAAALSVGLLSPGRAPYLCRFLEGLNHVTGDETSDERTNRDKAATDAA